MSIENPRKPSLVRLSDKCAADVGHSNRILSKTAELLEISACRVMYKF